MVNFFESNRKVVLTGTVEHADPVQRQYSSHQVNVKQAVFVYELDDQGAAWVVERIDVVGARRRKNGTDGAAHAAESFQPGCEWRDDCPDWLIELADRNKPKQVPGRRETD